MATLTKKQSKSLQSQIDEAKRQIESITASRQPLQRAGAMPLNSAQMGGASGRGYETYSDELSKDIQTASEGGVPMSALGDTNSSGETNLDKPKGYVEPKLSAAQSASYLKSFGLKGLADDASFVGLTAREANKRGLKLRQEKQSQVTAGTSAVYNPETINKTKRAIDAFGFALNDITKDPFNGKQSKLNKTESLISSTQKQLAKLFKTPEEFQNAYNTNQTFKDAIDNFQKMGGKADGVTSSIVAPVTPENAPQTQDTASYLADIKNPQANQQAQQSALDELIPERDLQQQEISRLAGIPKELEQYYFGNENEIGLIQQKKAEAEEEKRIVEREEKNAQNNLKAQAKLAIQKNKAEVQIQTAQVEENRLAAKNYMTGYLAKLGALNTTGAAGLAIQTLDTKYQIQKQTLETNAKYDNQTIELKLTDALNTIETDTDRSILKIQQDLSKTTEDVFKEVTKAQQEADKEIARISLSYAKTLREKTDDYVKKQKIEAEKYAKQFAKIASGGLDLTKLSQSIEGGELMEGQYVPKKGVLLPNGTFAKISLTPAQQQDVEAAGIVGLSNIRYFNNLPAAVREQIVREKLANDGKYDIDPTYDVSKNNYDVAKMQQVLKDYEDSKKTKSGATVPDDISKQIAEASNI